MKIGIYSFIERISGLKFHSVIGIIHKRHPCFYLQRKKLDMKQWFENSLLKLIDTEKFRSMVRKISIFGKKDDINFAVKIFDKF